MLDGMALQALDMHGAVTAESRLTVTLE